MEEMAKNVKNYLSQAKFGGHLIKAIRGVTESEQIFNDEDKLKPFLALNEERKSECTWTYTAAKKQAFEMLVLCWGLPKTFQGTYAEVVYRRGVLRRAVHLAPPMTSSFLIYSDSR